MKHRSRLLSATSILEMAVALIAGDMTSPPFVSLEISLLSKYSHCVDL